MKVSRTRSQEKILHHLKHCEQEVSAQALYVSLREANSPLGLATVYRALEALKLSGAIQARLLKNGETLYRLAHQDEHHLTCLQCGTSITITDEDCPVHELESHLQQSAQFEIYYHTLEFFGLCSPCQTAQAQAEG